MTHWRRVLGDTSAVFIGGLFGSAARALVGELVNPTTALIVVNLTGSLLLGLLGGWRLRTGRPARTVVNLIGIGVIGSFTTFSGFAAVPAEALRDGDVGGAVAFIVTSVTFGIPLTRAGLAVWSRT